MAHLPFIRPTVLTILLAVCTAALLTACEQNDLLGRPAVDAEPQPTHAIALLQPTEGSDTHGIVWFEQVGPESVRITATLQNLRPDALHGFHIHEFGDISQPDSTSAGDHYNPENMPHGRPEDTQRHAGDLGNIRADEDGVGRYERTIDQITIAGDRNPIVGRTLIVHRDPDRFTQPDGDAGPRIAVGLIGIADPQRFQ